ncbi:acyloxyacyl hydrolase [Antarcticibacterium sp. 1MA-6-2]|uniref:acyloxyacyl hydrolase n=1 Tax=Antarcticibacterium sp. 1MA-6-2 TaxID=2908210 RepID=UPI002882EBB3|nr:acyloxyacyl hydrolase [Antarcticibacterium sp. 1MA-6-2]
MKKIAPFLFLLACLTSFSQNDIKKYYSVDVNYFYGSIIEHNPHISHLITHHPEGLIFSFNRKTYGLEDWEARYNYPDVGFSFSYQDMKNPHLGDNYGLYAHLGFYFLKRNLVFKVGQGLAINTNPYHPDDNYINNAYGSRIMSSTFFSGTIQKENIYKGFGFQAGISLIHYSNADFKSPNNSTNTAVINAGINYLFDHENQPEYIPGNQEKYSEPLHYNFVLRGGANTIGIIGSKIYPFLTVSAYADKRINRKSTFQVKYRTLPVAVYGRIYLLSKCDFSIWRNDRGRRF